ncbi:L-seryl-tRNA(Sec) kinase isoform X3 [Myotis daubentonii]|uniref:L-seryl-tRNA(Sec) kinase isoform X3 n=1 Tax=Myotis daubentonii TaxID=98922 RepID=UPI002873C0CF|nr:L-seryl-tRNA(Sec) kinase isoform X3 [Myotis daubentonii]
MCTCGAGTCVYPLQWAPTGSGSEVSEQVDISRPKRLLKILWERCSLKNSTTASLTSRVQPSRWKSLRQELLKDLECFLRAVLHGDPLSAPPGGTEALWEALVTCLRGQALLPPAAEGPSHCRPTPAASRPLLLILDDNFYYRSMRYEVYQLARKYSLGFCQLFLDCPLETCVQRNSQRSGALPAETIRLMGAKMEEPNPEKNAWEHNSLMVRSPACSASASPELTGLLLAALENPVNCVEDNAEQKETDRIICSTNTLHQADQTLRRIVSETMKEAKGNRASVHNRKTSKCWGQPWPLNPSPATCTLECLQGHAIPTASRESPSSPSPGGSSAAVRNSSGTPPREET